MSNGSFLSLILVLVPACAGTAADIEPPPEEPPEGIAVPFEVSRYWAPSGYMGDGSTPGNVEGETDTSVCAPRPTGALGDCYRFTYQPAENHWAGVYWQFPANNWGTAEGKKIAPGATKVTFYASSAGGGEELEVTIGGVRDVTLPYQDDLKVTKKFVLTTEMTQYTVELPSQSFDSVIGGFSWITSIPGDANPEATQPITIYLDSIVWE